MAGAGIIPLEFTAVAVYIAALSSGSYGTPEQIDYEDSVVVQPQGDLMEVKSRGGMRKTVFVPTHADITLRDHGVHEGAQNIMFGTTSSSSGPAWQRRVAAAGRGFSGEFGIICKVLGEGTTAKLYGWSTCTLTEGPEQAHNQNEFMMQEYAIRALADDNDKLTFEDSYSDEDDIGTINAAFFDAFFIP
jgi:hypothetical protein